MSKEKDLKETKSSKSKTTKEKEVQEVKETQIVKDSELIEEREEVRGNIATGTIGAFLGAFVATIPWILMYIYGEMILSVLAIIIAAGALFGYKKLHGPIDKRLPIIISVASIVSVIVSTLIIIPLLLLKTEGLEMSIDNLERLYKFEEFASAITKDLIISVAFTILGISGIVSSTKKQIENKEDVKINFNNANTNMMNQNIEEARTVFTKLNALSKENAVSKEEVLANFENGNGKQIFNSLKMAQIIKKYQGNYYFNESYANSTLKRFLVLYAKIMFWVILVVAIFLILILL